MSNEQFDNILSFGYSRPVLFWAILPKIIDSLTSGQREQLAKLFNAKQGMFENQIAELETGADYVLVQQNLEFRKKIIQIKDGII